MVPKSAPTQLRQRREEDRRLVDDGDASQRRSQGLRTGHAAATLAECLAKASEEHAAVNVAQNRRSTGCYHGGAASLRQKFSEILNDGASTRDRDDVLADRCAQLRIGVFSQEFLHLGVGSLEVRYLMLELLDLLLDGAVFFHGQK